MKVKESNFFDYLGTEEHNLLASIANFKEEFNLFADLDRIYRKPLKRLDVNPNQESLIANLYLLTHFHLYFSVSCLLRSHLSECLASLRKAIDAALTAYEIILKPDTAKSYIDKLHPDHKRFRFIKSYIQTRVDKDQFKYPLAHGLIKIHTACSKFGSHADIDSFFHRLERREIPDQPGEELLLHYFQFPRQLEEYRGYFVLTLLAFLSLFRIFKVFFDEKLRIFDLEWELTIEKLDTRLKKLRDRYYRFIDSSMIVSDTPRT